jgi:4-amino-4-deoxy-L-arabinose transferase-like glycosyltransferase
MLALLTLGIGLGSSKRLSYHEAIVAQGAREMLCPGGDWLVPSIGGTPWLEKPPLAHWLVAIAGVIRGGIDETAARIPSALAAVLLAIAVGLLGARRFGARVGLFAAAIQLTTVWLVIRGRLADADMLLAFFVTLTLAAFDRLRCEGTVSRSTAWWFVVALGLTSLVKGIGFGAGIAGIVILGVLVWDRDLEILRRLFRPAGVAVCAGVSLAWPLLVAARHPEAVEIWIGHVRDRLTTGGGVYAGESLGSFLLSPLANTLPWTPLAVWGAVNSVSGARAERRGPDRLLCTWAFLPLCLLAFSSSRNEHYLIHALPPWSIWGALGLIRLGERLQTRRSFSSRVLRGVAIGGIGLVGVLYAVAHLEIVPRLDARGREWSWYLEASAQLRPAEEVILLYDWGRAEAWDRLPYATPFGPVPHDLAVRLFYLDRPARWFNGVDAFRDCAAGKQPAAVIARSRDLDAIRGSGRVTLVSLGPSERADRRFGLYRFWPREDELAGTDETTETRHE